MAKTIIITGASGNLGTATVKKMLTDGHRVIAVSNSHSNFDFARGNSNFESQSVNLSMENETQAFVEDVIQRYQTIDAALLLAGGFAMGDIESTTGSNLKKMYALNFETAYYVVRPLFTHMVKNGFGRIAFVGARPALSAANGKNMIAYALSKSLLFKLSEYLNEASKGTNVVSSVIVPSTIDTPQNRESMPNADFDTWVRAEQIADTLSFICSDIAGPLREPVYKLYNNA